MRAIVSSLANAISARATLSAPRTIRRAARTTPPPSVTSSTSGASAASTPATSPVRHAVRNRSVASACWGPAGV